MHRFEAFYAVRSRCHLTYTDVCDRGDAYVTSDADEARFPITCSGCVAAKSSLRAPPSAQPEAVRSSQPPSSDGPRRDERTAPKSTSDAPGGTGCKVAREPSRVEDENTSARGGIALSAEVAA